MTKEQEGRRQEDRPEVALLYLRNSLVEILGQLRDRSESYYYLCKVYGEAPAAVRPALLSLIDQCGTAYSECFVRIRDAGVLAVKLCEELSGKESVDREIDQLQSGPEEAGHKGVANGPVAGGSTPGPPRPSNRES